MMVNLQAESSLGSEVLPTVTINGTKTPTPTPPVLSLLHSLMLLPSSETSMLKEEIKELILAKEEPILLCQIPSETSLIIGVDWTYNLKL